MTCPKCMRELDYVEVSFEARGNGRLIIEKGDALYVEDESYHEKDDYECPYCGFDFESPEDAADCIDLQLE